ncbi:ABC transporter ATP-binding protein [Cutibacterium sp. V947]|uniref:ABC transporter ATP-binding protein n=1 Tax=unclassified Cutibacterium TaxID=2649671 RepID=UPI003EE2E1D5
MICATDVVVRRGERIVLDRVDVTANQGMTIGIIGPNGAGKSTLLSALYRNVSICSGQVTVSERDVAVMSRRDIAREVAVVAQTPDQALPLTVRDTVGLGRLPHRSLMGYGDAADREIVEDALARTDLTRLACRLVTQLSGGERQRVLVARAIAQQAGHLLLDEPTNHLDIGHQFDLLNLVHTIDATTIIVLHDLNLAARVADQLVLLNKGCLVASGPCEEVLRPDLLSEIYRVDVEHITHNGRIHLLFNPPDR